MRMISISVFLFSVLLIPQLSFASQPATQDCSGLLAHFEGKVNLLEFEAKIHAAAGKRVQVPLGEGAEGTVELVGQIDGGRISIWVEKRFFTRQLALESYQHLKKMKELESEGLLAPFKVIQPISLTGKTLKLEYLPGQTFAELRNNETYLEDPKFDEIFDNFIKGLSLVAESLKAKGYHTTIETLDDADKTPSGLYVSETPNFDIGRFELMDGEAPLFSVIDINVVVDPKTHVMTIIDPH